MSSDKSFISFPPGYLGGKPIKFPLLANDERLFAISKPCGISTFQHEWTLGKPDIAMALRRELLKGKPQLAKLGIEGLYRVFNLDAELSGVLLFAKNEENEGILKNASGSGQFIYRYHILVSTETVERSIRCDLPIAKHFHDRRMLVSHKTGRKCETQFNFLRPFGQYQLWEAVTSDMRTHQIRIHAAEMGLSIVGEWVYSDGGEVFLSALKKDYRSGKGREEPIYDGLCLHLVEVDFANVPEFEHPPIVAPLPGRFETLLKRLDGHRGRRG